MFHSEIPRPPGPGSVFVADGRNIARRWMVGLSLFAVLVMIGWNFGLDRLFDDMRREYCAMRYLQSAQIHATQDPVRNDRARYELNRAIALAPESRIISQNVFHLFIALRAYEEAIPWFEKQPDGGLMARTGLGQSLLMTGRTDQGRATIHQVLNEAKMMHEHSLIGDGMFFLLLNNAAYSLADADTDIELAVRLLETVVGNAPLNPAYLDSLGWAYYRQSRYSDAAFYLERSVRLMYPQESAEILYHLGATYARLNRLQEARRALERCLTLDASWVEAKDELEALGKDLPPPLMVQKARVCGCDTAS